MPRPILFSAHMDVVDARPEDWERDPFRLVEENGYFFGRGTLDIKGEIALITATFLRLKAEKFVPSRDLIIAFSGDDGVEVVGESFEIRGNRIHDCVDPSGGVRANNGAGAAQKPADRFAALLAVVERPVIDVHPHELVGEIAAHVAETLDDALKAPVKRLGAPRGKRITNQFGGTLGGNATLIGASSNIVSAGICAAQGRPVGFAAFMRYGVPMTVCQLAVSAAYVAALFVVYNMG